MGAFPISEERLGAYLAKAVREAKLHTSWTAPDEAYEQAVQAYAAGVLADRAIMSALEEYVTELVEPGRVNALAMKLLQLTMPGIPDSYQGSELWDLSLVDPDNRRPVDFGERARLSSALDRAEATTPRVEDSGAAKLHLMRSALRLRRRRPELFGAAADYEPLEVSGSAAEHVVAFARGAEGHPGRAVTVVPRLVLGLRQAGGWKDTAVALPPGEWIDVITGRRHSGMSSANGEPSSAYLLKLLRDFPVALLVTSEAAGD